MISTKEKIVAIGIEIISEKDQFQETIKRKKKKFPRIQKMNLDQNLTKKKKSVEKIPHQNPDLLQNQEIEKRKAKETKDQEVDQEGKILIRQIIIITPQEILQIIQ